MKKSLILLALFLGACEFDQTLEYQIDPRIENTVNEFFKEAEARGVFIPKENLKAIIVKKLDGNYGQARTNGDQRIILLIEICTLWDRPHQEVIVFHELGHALLKRGHTCENNSIMCDQVKLSAFIGDPDKRRILLDELFNN